MRSFLVLAIAVLASCATADSEMMPEGNWVLLPGTAVRALLAQCSRSAPTEGEATWQPSNDDIARMEALLPSALADAAAARGTDFSDLGQRWQRQYVGLVRNGRRFIYGNFFPVHEQNELTGWRERPMIACDGGPPYFGAEFDVDGGLISHLAFNGAI